MSVRIGSARIDENGKAWGGIAGDQTGGEVATQKWYLHTLGWRVLRPVDPKKGAKIAACMLAACDNPHIGYDQYQRNTLYQEAAKRGFDCAGVARDVETDCSALVRVCLAYAGIEVEDFRTCNEARILLATGEFTEKTGASYTASSSRLRTGDVLVTPCSGHTVVVLSDGERAFQEQEEEDMDLLKNGSKGPQVKTLQRLLNAVCGANLQVDGEYGPATCSAVRGYQKMRALNADGQCGAQTWTNLLRKED